MRKSFLLLIWGILAVFFFSASAKARDDVSDWYIKDFESEIIVHEDSSLTITEKILADCGYATEKHGIFRVLPLQLEKKGTEPVKTPIKLISVTDFNGRAYKYIESVNVDKHTISWQVGDPEVFVQGEQEYKIVYEMKNVIRFNSVDSDKLYLDLNGNYWDFEIDEFNAKIIFPESVTDDNSQAYLSRYSFYDGTPRQRDEELSEFNWDRNVLNITSRRTLQMKEGISALIIMPKKVFTPYKLTDADNSMYPKDSRSNAVFFGIIDKVLNNFRAFWPVFVLAVCYLVWIVIKRQHSNK